MKKYRTKQTKILYSTQTAASPFPLSDTFRGKIAFKETAEIKAVSFFFATYESICHGHLSIVLKFSNVTLDYEIDMRDIEDNKALTLPVKRKVLSDSTMEYEIRVSYAGGNILAMWFDGREPCLVVTGEEVKEITLDEEPLISVLVPVYKCPVRLLKATIDSVLKQTYTNWELCIVDDCSKDDKLEKYLKKLFEKSNVKVVFFSKNQGISGATNKALSIASGDFVCFLDNDDLLDKEALLEVAFAANQKLPNGKKPDLIYSDEDKISEGGKCFDPYYKPDWNYTMLLSQNYICHLAAYRKSVLDKIGGLDKKLDGSQDYDLLLRFIEHTDSVYHIPKILYHWRTLKGSTANGIGFKVSARINGLRAINNHLERTKQNAEVSMGFCPGTYSVNLKLSNDYIPSIGIIIPFKDKVDYLCNLLHSIRNSTYKNVQTLLIDNGSSAAELKKLSKTTFSYLVEYDKPFNYSKLNNFGAAFLRHVDHYLFLNNDVEAMNVDWIERMVQHFNRQDVGAVGAKLLYPDHRIQHAGVIIGLGGIAGHSHKYQSESSPGYFSRPHLIQEVSAVTGACLMVRREDFDAVGGFEEELPKAFNDVDFCLKLRKNNRKIVYTPEARLLHYESLSRGLDNHKDIEFKEAIEYMNKKWGCSKFQDPYYNPNLTLEREDFSFKV